jgi:hypothetical protein
LRYYYASKLTSRVDDLDLSFDEFAAKVNSDMVGNVVNLGSRTARFAEQTGLSAIYPIRLAVDAANHPGRTRLNFGILRGPIETLLPIGGDQNGSTPNGTIVNGHRTHKQNRILFNLVE